MFSPVNDQHSFSVTSNNDLYPEVKEEMFTKDGRKKKKTLGRQHLDGLKANCV